MTAQEVFDFVVHALREQGVPSIDTSDFRCQYRAMTESGRTLKCAVGHLIPDDLYSPDLESLSPDNTVMQRVLARLELTEHTELLTDLQRAHDESAFLYDPNWLKIFLDDARKVAEKHGLDPSAALE